MVRVGIALPFVFTAVFAANCTDEPTRPRVPLKPSAQVAAAASRIAFSSNRDGSYQIYVMDADGSAATRLTSLPGQNSEPSWAPDGRHIAFVSTQDGNYEIYVMDADGATPTRLTTNVAVDAEPIWSPDGQRLAFVSTRDGRERIYVMNADGSAQTRLTDGPGSDTDPSWSPDGQRIAFWSNRDAHSEIYVMNADGSAQTKLTSDPADYTPRWSPDGLHIAFGCNRGGGNLDICGMAPDGSAETALTSAAGSNSQPSWSPDAQQIAFTSTRDGNSEIYVINADGCGPTRLTNSPGEDVQPSWSPGQVTRGALAFVTQPPPTVESGVTLSPPVQVAVQDSSGNTVSGATDAVTVALGENPGAATLTGTTTVGAVNGIATFTDLRVDRPGSGYTLVATAAVFARATSTPFTVFTQHTLAFVTQPPAATAANAALTPAVQVAIQDSLGQTVTGATDTVTLVLGSNSTGAILLGTTTVPAVNGVATFSDLRVDRPGAGRVRFKAGGRDQHAVLRTRHVRGRGRRAGRDVRRVPRWCGVLLGRWADEPGAGSGRHHVHENQRRRFAHLRCCDERCRILLGLERLRSAWEWDDDVDDRARPCRGRTDVRHTQRRRLPHVWNHARRGGILLGPELVRPARRRDGVVCKHGLRPGATGASAG